LGKKSERVGSYPVLGFKKIEEREKKGKGEKLYSTVVPGKGKLFFRLSPLQPTKEGERRKEGRVSILVL